MAEPRTLGLRTQIVLALAGVMALAFLPLFFAVASLARATLLDARQESAQALGRAVAAHVAEVDGQGRGALVSSVLEAHVGHAGVAAIAVYDKDGTRIAEAGDPNELALMHPPERPYGEAARNVRGARGRALDVVIPEKDHAIQARVRTDDAAAEAAPLVQLVALYMSCFALGLLVFAYFALTRLIVKPIEALMRAADRVASSDVAIDVPRGGAAEVADLASSVRDMAARLLRDQRSLREKIQELTLTTHRLTEAQGQLVRSERMASVGRLAAGVAHEIGNPLAAIMGMQDLLQDGDLPPETQQDFVSRMKKETLRIHSVLRDLLDFARPEKPSAVPSVAPPADVGAVILDVFSLVRPQRAFKTLELVADVDADGLHVVLPASRLTQVILNLVLNAGDALGEARPDGEGSITVRAAKEGDKVRITVEDDGPGVPAEMREKIFEPFVTTKPVGEGTGLGLAVCRGIVESASGELVLDAGYDKGARFVVTLPAN